MKYTIYIYILLMTNILLWKKTNIMNFIWSMKDILNILALFTFDLIKLLNSYVFTYCINESIKVSLIMSLIYRDARYIIVSHSFRLYADDFIFYVV